MDYTKPKTIQIFISYFYLNHFSLDAVPSSVDKVTSTVLAKVPSSRRTVTSTVPATSLELYSTSSKPITTPAQGKGGRGGRKESNLIKMGALCKIYTMGDCAIRAEQFFFMKRM